MQTRLTDAIEQLPQPAQTVFRMSRYEHLSVQVITRQLDVSPKMVACHLTRALKLLLRQLKELIPVFLLLASFR